jgi:hypothetical protein
MKRKLILKAIFAFDNCLVERRASRSFPKLGLIDVLNRLKEEPRFLVLLYDRSHNKESANLTPACCCNSRRLHGF